MLATILLVACALVLIGKRADRVYEARAVSETVSDADPRLTSRAIRDNSSPGRSTVSLSAPRPALRKVRAVGLYRGKPARYWAFMYRERTRQLQRARRALHRRWQPTVDYALRLASAVFGVSYWQLRSVSFCESRHNVYAANGRYLGIFQLSWSPYGFSPFDPVASALSTAATVRREGWGQWECKP